MKYMDQTRVMNRARQILRQCLTFEMLPMFFDILFATTSMCFVQFKFAEYHSKKFSVVCSLQSNM